MRGFVARLPGGGRTLEPQLTDTELARGIFPAARLAPPSRLGAASERAGDASSPALLEGWPVALTILAAAAGAGAFVIRRLA